MNGKLADPSPFAFGAFSFAWWMACMIEAGWFSVQNHAEAIVMGFTLAGTGLVLAGVLEYFRGDTFRTVLFLFLGLGWWFAAVQHTWFTQKLSSGFSGFDALCWTVILFILWLASFSKKNVLLQLFLLGLWISFGLWTIAAWGVPVLSYIGGYVGLITAILGFIIFIQEVFSAGGGAQKAAAGSNA
ncbi:MAG: GPR1/FUN34/YaaH family transporter [Acidobacteriota bacterium]